MKKVLVVFGTRPEAIKLAPVVDRLAACAGKIETVVCSTAQHRELLDMSLKTLGISPDHDLGVMEENQSLFTITAKALGRLEGVLDQFRPDLVLVQGDTTTAFAAGLAAYYRRIALGHVEAGLRTGDKYRPFPEECNRRMLSVLADLHFAPTPGARARLLGEGVDDATIWVTGNTVIDALLRLVELQREPGRREKLLRLFRERHGLDLDSPAGEKIVVVTAHRRENFNEGLRGICGALKELAAAREDLRIVFPVHPNPNVRGPVGEALGNVRGVHLLEPLEYYEFVFLLSRAALALTDSGGIQEEAPSLAVPVLVMRDRTERPEGVEAGTARLVGTDRKAIVSNALEVLGDSEVHRAMSSVPNPYGDGKAAARIVDVILGLGDGAEGR